MMLHRTHRGLSRFDFDRHGRDKPTPGATERARLGHFASRAHYPGWQFSVKADSGSAALIAFRPHPITGALQRLGPWPLPEDAGEEEVRAAALAAVVEADGPGAADRFAWLAPK